MYHKQFRRSRRSLAAAAGILLVTALTVGSPGLAQSDEAASGRPARGAAKVVPLSADLEISRLTVEAGGQQQTEKETQHLYRDGKGRTRTEAGSTVTITDPVGKSTLVLDTKSRTYERTAKGQSPRPADTGTRDVSNDQKLASAPRFLGTSTVSGVKAEGRVYDVSLPARGKHIPARQKEVTLWLSVDLQLPVQTRVVEPSGAANTQTYTNIKAGTEPAAELFEVPAGYREAGAAGTDGMMATCPLDNDDPVIMTSFGYVYLDSRNVNAITDVGAGCVFVADGGVFEYPLYGYPTVDLLLPFDQWFVYDCYCALPYLPYVAFGDIVFVAANASEPDTTTKDSFITLTIFPA